MLFNDTKDCFPGFRHFSPISKQHCFSSWSVSIETRFSRKEKSVIRRDCLEDFAVELYKSIITKMLLLQKSNSERDLVRLLIRPSVGRSVHLSIKRFSKNAKSNEFKLKQYNSGLFATIGQCTQPCYDPCWLVHQSVHSLIRHYQAKLKLKAKSESRSASLSLPVNVRALTLCVWPYLNTPFDAL